MAWRGLVGSTGCILTDFLISKHMKAHPHLYLDNAENPVKDPENTWWRRQPCQPNCTLQSNETGRDRAKLDWTPDIEEGPPEPCQN